MAFSIREALKGCRRRQGLIEIIFHLAAARRKTTVASAGKHPLGFINSLSAGRSGNIPKYLAELRASAPHNVRSVFTLGPSG
ncbi:hypothetical protein [Pseudomonas sp. PB3P13]